MNCGGFAFVCGFEVPHNDGGLSCDTKGIFFVKRLIDRATGVRLYSLESFLIINVEAGGKMA